jgi:hypothetical protein
LPWGEEKSIIAVRGRKNRYRREAKKKTIIAVRQRKIDYHREVKKN